MNNNDVTLTVNQSLVKLDNLVNAVDYLVQELETRKEEFLSPGNLVEEMKNVVDEYSFKRTLFNYIQSNHGDGIVREVAFYVMEKIDDSIEEFINNRVNKALEAAGVTPNTQA